MCQDGRKWQPFVPSEGPELTTAGRDSGNCRCNKRDDYYGSHNISSGVGVCGIVEDLDERRVGGRREN